MSKKILPILFSNLIYKTDQNFLDIQYFKKLVLYPDEILRVCMYNK